MRLSILSILFFVSNAAFALPASDSAGTAPSALKNPKEIVFIHGLFVTPKCWDKWEAYFSAAGYQVSAPAWPSHDGNSPQALQAEPDPDLTKVTFDDVLNSYRQILQAKKDNPPILIGHSLGGLIAQILLSEGLGSAAISIDSAPPKGIISTDASFYKANWPVLSHFLNQNSPVTMSLDQFTYAFTNAESPEVQADAYSNSYVPESYRIAAGALTLSGAINPTTKRGPLLLIAGSEDHIIPADLNYKNFELYKFASTNFTQFQLFVGFDHWIIGTPNWQQVAEIL